MRRDEPCEADVRRVKNWKNNWPGLLKFMESIWPTYGCVRHPPSGNWEFVTGGWSGCEEIIGAFHDNVLARSQLWRSTHRGGLHILREKEQEPEENEYHWSSVEFSEYVRIWAHPIGHQPGEPGGIAIRLNVESLKELASILHGARLAQEIKEGK